MVSRWKKERIAERKKRPVPRSAVPDQRRALKDGERMPSDDDPTFVIRCECGGWVRGTLADAVTVSGVHCDSCTRTYTVERCSPSDLIADLKRMAMDAKKRIL